MFVFLGSVRTLIKFQQSNKGNFAELVPFENLDQHQQG